MLIVRGFYFYWFYILQFEPICEPSFCVTPLIFSKADFQPFQLFYIGSDD